MPGQKTLWASLELKRQGTSHGGWEDGRAQLHEFHLQEFDLLLNNEGNDPVPPPAAEGPREPWEDTKAVSPWQGSTTETVISAGWTLLAEPNRQKAPTRPR